MEKPTGNPFLKFNEEIPHRGGVQNSNDDCSLI
jgi:hypothetical protein